MREHRPRLRPVEQVPQRTSQGGQFSIPPGYLPSRHTQHHARSTTPRRHRHKISGCSTCFSRAKNAIRALSTGRIEEHGDLLDAAVKHLTHRDIDVHGLFEDLMG
ncbi:DUF6317 family protein [Streptomyces hygroscopicus]|uniref:DUF6317 family protein n=1 Tax=Streptomyces hygroscopicus TaxID=1912 RepID=UPI003A100C9C